MAFEIPAPRCTSATLQALGGIIFSTTLALNSSLYRGIPSSLSAPSRVKFTVEDPADFYADRGGGVRVCFMIHKTHISEIINYIPAAFAPYQQCFFWYACAAED